MIQAEAKRGHQYYATDRWLGGMLTNFATIRKSVKRLTNIEKMETDGTFDKITKKETLFLSREKEKLQKSLSGIVDMTRLPGALFVIDVKKEAIAVQEANRLGIPVFAMVDTNCDTDGIDYVIPANDDALKSIQLIARVVTDAIVEGNARKVETAPESEEAVKQERSEKNDRRERRPRRPQQETDKA